MSTVSSVYLKLLICLLPIRIPLLKFLRLLVYKGVRQGYVLSLYLFNIVAENLCHYVKKVQR